MAASGPLFLSKDTLDCDKMKWSSSAGDVVIALRRLGEGEKRRPAAAPPGIYHLSRTQRWHLFILPLRRSRNQFHSNIWVWNAGRSVQLHISAIWISYGCIWGNLLSPDVLDGYVFFFSCADGVGEWLRRRRHADTTVRKRSEAVPPLLAWWRIRCLPCIWGMQKLVKSQYSWKNKDHFSWCKLDFEKKKTPRIYKLK